ncbi:sensor histidine kinase [Aneurinibacillus terranovensis]|uniref:sensor histidine kinase n=1 Tax=Aneurinibacillus terranovensis TaxID=278991 RepID=UPI000488188D|nr:ATP-binding protein [Aneurinibacillus terranovensis]
MGIFVFIFYSVPEMCLIIALTITLAGYNLSANKLKCFICSLFLACFVDIFRDADIDIAVRLVLQFLIFVISIKYVFKIPFMRLFVCTVSTLLLVQITELAAMNTAMAISDKTLGELQSHPFLWLLAVWPILIILSLFLYFIRKRNFSIFKGEIYPPTSLFGSFYSYLIFTAFYTLSIIGAELLTGKLEQSNPSIVLIFTFQIFSVLMVREFIKSQVRETELSFYKEYVRDVTSLFTTIRAQRHDFSNHIQVLYIFLKQRDYSRMLQYIEQLVGQIKTLNQVLISDNPGLSALLQAKLSRFEEEGISISLDIMSTLTELNINMIEMNQIIGNLLDNAADAIKAAGYPTDEIHLQTLQEIDHVKIKVKNYRPVIPPDIQKKVFDHGFSTKPNHSGIGLAIVSELVNKNNGSIALLSNEIEGTVFTIRFPVKGEMQFE